LSADLGKRAFVGPLAFSPHHQLIFALWQVSYLGRWFFVQLKLYSGFLEQVLERVISVAAKGYEALYFGIHQHLGAEYTWWMRGVDCGASKVNAMERCLYDYVLLGVNCPAYFLSGPRLYTEFVPEATKLKAIFEPGGGAIIAGG